VDLASAVGSEHDDLEAPWLFTVPISGIVIWKSGQYFKKIRLERLVGAVQFVDQQYRRRALAAFEGLHQRALDEKGARRRCPSRPCRATPLESRPALISIICCGVVPLIYREAMSRPS